MSIENDVIKAMISLSNTVKEADGIIKEFAPQHNTYAEKRNFLFELFPNILIIGGCDGKEGNKDQTDYEAALSVVINLKWQ